MYLIVLHIPDIGLPNNPFKILMLGDFLNSLQNILDLHLYFTWIQDGIKEKRWYEAKDFNQSHRSLSGPIKFQAHSSIVDTPE